MKTNDNCDHEFRIDGGNCIHCQKTVIEIFAINQSEIVTGKQSAFKTVTKTIIKENSGYYHTYVDNDPTMKDEVFARIIKYCTEHNCFEGETLQQDDDCLLDAPNVLSEIIDDIIKFECTEINE